MNKFVFFLSFTILLIWLFYTVYDALNDSVYVYPQKELNDIFEKNYLDNDRDIVRKEIHKNLPNKKSGPLKRRYPDAIVLGIKKCGTGALGEMLKLHPEVAPPDAYHVHFFENDMIYKKGLKVYKVSIMKYSSDCGWHRRP